MDRKLQYYLEHMFITTPGSLVFYLECLAVLMHKKDKCPDRCSTLTPEDVPHPSQDPRSVFIIEVLYYLSLLTVSKAALSHVSSGQ